MTSKIKIGWAEANITPDKRVSLTGQFAERISLYVEKPLTATAMVIEGDGECVIFCSCDLVNTSWKLVEGVRGRLKELNAPFDTSRVVLNGTHIHTGPAYGGARRKDTNVVGGSIMFEWIERFKTLLAPGQRYVEKESVSDNPEIATKEENYAMLVDRISSAIMEAWNNRREGSFANAFGRAAVGMCRRIVYMDDTAEMWGDSNTPNFKEVEGGSDSGIELLFAFDDNRELTGIIVNIACPAQCVQHRLFVSPDYWGEVKMLLRKHFGEHIFVLTQCSAAGDQCPVDLVRWVEPESDVNDPNCKHINPKKRKADPSMFDLSGMRVAGRRIANEIIAVYEESVQDVQTEVELEHRVIDMPLPIRKVTEADKDNAERAIREYLKVKSGDVDYIDVANIESHLGIIMRYEEQQKSANIDTEIHVIRLGSVAFATNPFELFLDFGNRIKAQVDCEQIFLIQLANGCEDYLPTEKAEKHGHFSAYVSSGLVGHEGGDILVEQTLKNVNEMFS